MEGNRPANIDSPSVDDRLGFDLYARGIARTIRDASSHNQLPLTLGIYGRWGSGKTSLMRMVEAELLGTRSPSLQTELDRQVFKVNARRIWIVQAIWLGLLIAAVVFGPWTIRLLQSRFHLSAESAAFGFLWGVLAMLGGFARGLFATWWQGYVEKRWVSGGAWIVMRVPQSLLLGLIALFLVVLNTTVRARILASSLLLVLCYVIAFLLGLFAAEILSVFSRVRSMFRPAPPPTSPQPSTSQFQVIWFDAWKYAQEEELWATLLQRLLTEIKVNAEGSRRIRIKWELWKRSIQWNSGFFDVAKKLLPTVGRILASLVVGGIAFWISRMLWPANSQTQVTHAASTAAGLLSSAGVLAAWLRTNVESPLADVDFGKYRKKASYRDHLTFLTEFGEELKTILTIARNVSNPVVLMLDDLDRCLPEQAVSVLEAIKLFVGDEAPVVFVVGADREFVERAVDVMYASLKDKDDPNLRRKERFADLGREYLEKIVQLPFNLPPIDLARIDTFIDERFAEDTLVTDNSQIFAAGLLANPRQVVRAVSTFRFVARLADENGALYAKTILPAILAKLVVIQYRWSDLYAELVDRPALLHSLEASYGGAVPDPAIADAVARHQSKSGLQQMLTLPPSVAGTDLVPYLFITARAQDRPHPAAANEAPPASSSPPPSTQPSPSVAAAVQVETPTPRGPDPPVLAQPVAAQPVAASASPSLKFSVNDLRRFGDLLTTLSNRGGDSALISRLYDSNNRIQSYLASNSVDAAQKTLTESIGVAERALQELQDKESAAAPTIDVGVASDGTLQFQRAITYNPLEIFIREETGSQAFRCSIFDRGRQVATWLTPFPAPDLLTASAAFKTGSISEEQLKLLGRGLVTGVLKLLPSSFDIRSSRRLHLMSTPAMDDMPWEAMFLAKSEDFIGLDPRHSLVRGYPEPPGVQGPPTFPLSVLLVGFAGPNPSAPSYLVDLGDAFKPVSTKGAVSLSTMEGPTLQEVRDSLRRDRPHIVHMVAQLGSLFLSGDQVVFPVTGQTSIPLETLGNELKEAGVSLVVLDIPQSRELARELARYVPAVVGSQNMFAAMPEFAAAFYTAFFRTGQTDFAITEGRRAVRAINVPAPDPNVPPVSMAPWALGPVLYQIPGSGLIFEPSSAGPPTSAKSKTGKPM